MARLVRAVGAVVIFLTVCSATSQTDTYRLPQTCKPHKYVLYIRPEFYDADRTPTFRGSALITVTCSEPTNRITLHQHKLTIHHKKVTSLLQDLPFHVEEDEERDFYTVMLDDGEVFKPYVPYNLSFTFTGVMRSDGLGLYYSTYTADDGELVGIAATQMEPTFARSVFPCFDEPGFKSTFTATIARRTDTGRAYTTVFNSKLEKSYQDPEDERWTLDVYQTSPIMSTYLVALLVSDFEAVSNNIDLDKIHRREDSGQVLPYRTLMKPGDAKQVELSHKTGIKMFRWMDSHMAPPYENFLSKIDSVSLPKFLGAGMENWGLVFYRSSVISFTKGLTNMYTRRSGMLTTAHEMVHQWFGNIVSPKWWDSTWLNEGFAAYWQYYLPQTVFPQSREDELSVSLRDLAMMQTDGSNASRPMRQEVQTPSEAMAMFDRYSYFKGSAIVRMLHMIMGDNFLPALNYYLKKNMLSSVDSDDLWNALDEFAEMQGRPLNLSDRMPSWVEQKGYPVLWATRGRGKWVTLRQELFPVENTTLDIESPFLNRFDIPIQVSSGPCLKKTVIKSESQADDSEEDDSKEKDSKEKHSKDKDSEEKYSKEKDSEEKYSKEKDSEEKYSKEKDSKEKYSKEKDSEEKYSKEKDSKEKYSKEKDSKEKDSEEKYSKEKDSEEKHSKDKDSEEKYSKDKDSEEKYSKDKDSEENDSEEKYSKEKDSYYHHHHGHPERNDSSQHHWTRTFGSGMDRNWTRHFGPGMDRNWTRHFGFGMDRNWTRHFGSGMDRNWTRHFGPGMQRNWTRHFGPGMQRNWTRTFGPGMQRNWTRHFEGPQQRLANRQNRQMQARKNRERQLANRQNRRRLSLEKKAKRLAAQKQREMLRQNKQKQRAERRLRMQELRRTRTRNNRTRTWTRGSRLVNGTRWRISSGGRIVGNRTRWRNSSGGRIMGNRTRTWGNNSGGRIMGNRTRTLNHGSRLVNGTRWDNSGRIMGNRTGSWSNGRGMGNGGHMDNNERGMGPRGRMNSNGRGKGHRLRTPNSKETSLGGRRFGNSGETSLDNRVGTKSSNRRGKGKSYLTWFPREEEEVRVKVKGKSSCYVLNDDHMGYYRVLYDQKNYKALHHTLMTDPQALSPLTRATILDDAFSFHKVGGKYREAVKGWPFMLTQYLRSELSFPAWQVFQREMKHYGRLLLFSGPKLMKRYNKFITGITGPVLEKLTFDVPRNAQPYDSYIRTWVAEIGCKSREKYCLKYAKRAVKRHRRSGKPLNVNFQEALYCGALGGKGKAIQDIFQFVLEQLAQARYGWEKVGYLRALGCVRDSQLIGRLLIDTLNGEVPGLESSSSMRTVMEQFAFSQYPSEVTLRFLVDNFDSIVDRIDSITESQTMVKNIFEYLSTGTEYYNIVKPLLTKMSRMEESWQVLVEEMKTAAEDNALYMKSHQNIFKKWLRLKA